MAFCSNCGHELPEGTKFCSYCGAAVNNNVVNISENNEQNTQGQGESQYNEPVRQDQWQDSQRTTYIPQSSVETVSASPLDKYGKFIGIGLLILAIVDFATDPPFLTIILSAAIIGGAVFCLAKKYKLKGFPIAAIVLAAICLIAGVSQANRYGMFKIPGRDEETVNNVAEEKVNAEAAPKTEETESTSAKTDNGSKTEAFNPKKDEPASKVTESASTESQDSDSPTEENAVDTGEKDENKKESSGVDPDLKAFLDSYEEFVDEYVVFMKKYMADPTNAISMLSEYSEIMGKYADFAEKVDQYDSKEMSTEDAKYYLEVTTRCSQKMLDIYGN